MEDILLLIGSFLPIKNLLCFASISKPILSLIKNNSWYQPVKLKNTLPLNYYQFKNVDLSNTNVTDESVSHLTQLHTLDLSDTIVTDESVRYLTQLHTLDLRGTQVTDESVCYLTRLHTLNLKNTKVTDESVRYLTRLHTLNL